MGVRILGTYMCPRRLLVSSYASLDRNTHLSPLLLKSIYSFNIPQIPKIIKVLEIQEKFELIQSLLRYCDQFKKIMSQSNFYSLEFNDSVFKVYPTPEFHPAF